MAELQDRVGRVIHAHRIAEPGVVLASARASVRQWGVRVVRTRAFGALLLACLVSAWGVAATPSFHHTVRPPASGTTLTTPLPTKTVLESSDSGLKGGLKTGEEPPSGAAGGTGTARAETPGRAGSDLSSDIPDLPPASDDEDLEAALSELDRRADRDQLMGEQSSLTQQPLSRAPGPPADLQNQPPPDPAQPVTSTPVQAP